MDVGLVGRNRELPVLLAVTICLGAAWATEATGLSPALGAFLAGMLLSDTRYADQIRADVAPFKTVFVTVFFASVGMLMDLRWAVGNWALVLSVALLIVVGKAVITFAAIRPFQSSVVYALGAGLALAQLGEFSFVLAQTSQTSGLLTQYGFQVVVSSTVLTLLASPYLVALGSYVSHALSARIPHKLAPTSASSATGKRLSGHAVVVGYGNAGQAAVGELRSRGVEVSIVDLHTRSLNAARREGLEVVVGDGAHESVLMAAGVERAACAIVAVPDPKTARQVLAAVKHISPELKTVVRSRYHAMLGEFLALGADRVVDEEKITGRRLAKYAWDIAFDLPPMDVSLR
jgi:CPA2 family monovalent cation:H+ antiporter-2